MSTASNSAPLIEPLLITAQDFARMLSISVRSLWRLRSAGDLPTPVKIGAAVRWKLDDVKTFIAKGCPRAQAREN